MFIGDATSLVFCIQRDAADSGRPWRVEMSIKYDPPADDSTTRGAVTSWYAHLIAGSHTKPLTYDDLLAINADLSIGDQIAAWRPFSDAERPPPK